MSTHQADYLHKTGVRVTIAGAAINVILVICKFIAGYFGKSTAMIADSVHSLSDLITDFIVLISIRISSKPSDDCHPYGHGRAETIGATIIGFILLAVGLEFIIKAIETIRTGNLLVPTNIAIAGAVISVLLKEAAYRYTINVGRSVDSQVIIANAHHHRSDALSSVVALVGIAGAMAGYEICDSVAAIAVAFFILKVGFDVAWEGIQELMDASVSRETRREIEETIIDAEEVVSFHDLKTRKIGRETLVDVHIQVHPYISVSEGHNIAEKVRKSLHAKMKNMGEVMVHIDAEDDGPGIHYGITRNELEQKVREAIRKIESLGKHFDIQVHYLSGKALLEIYVELPSEMPIKEGKEIARKVRNDLTLCEEIQDVKVRLNLVE